MSLLLIVGENLHFFIDISSERLVLSLEPGAGTISTSISLGHGHFLPDFLSVHVLLFHLS